MVSARILSSLTSVAYVGSVYIFPGGRVTERRDELPVIIRRVLGVCIMTAFSVVNYGFSWQRWAATFDTNVAFDVLKALGILHLIYLPTVFAFGNPEISLKDWKARVKVFRDLVVGPVTEELVYRGLIVSLYQNEGYSTRTILTENFLYFGFAHFHHAIMNWLDKVTPLKVAMTQGLIQFVITSLFGTYACYLLLKTGTVWPSVVSHMVCNYYGPPRMNGPTWYIPLTAAGIAAWAYCLKEF